MSRNIHIPNDFKLTCLNQELLVLLYVWDCRFQSLMSQASANSVTLGSIKYKQFPEKIISLDETDKRIITQKEEENKDNLIINNDESGGKFCDAGVEQEDNDVDIKNNVFGKEINIAKPFEPSINRSCCSSECSDEKVDEMSDENGKIVLSIHEGTLSAFASASASASASESFVTSSSNCDVNPIDVSSMESAEGTGFDSCSINTMTGNSDGWIWHSFRSIRKDFWMDYSNGHLNKFESIINYTPKFLSPLSQIVSQERGRLCYPIGADGFAISIYEDEISSIIACAEIVFQEKYLTSEEKAGKFQLYTDSETEAMQKLSSSDCSVSSSKSMPSVPVDDNSSDHFQFSENMHQEIPLGVEKDKNRFSVVCIYGKHFLSLRRQCCSSEIGYISSLGRCKKWNPQGGKSKVLFAKTLDERFIIKEINKTELASFLKFAPRYFIHVLGSLKSGNQTCLAKIMGIYQVFFIFTF